MTTRRNVALLVSGFFSISSIGGYGICTAQPKPKDHEPKDAAGKEKSTGDKEKIAASQKEGKGSESLSLPGIDFTVPKGWVQDQIPASPMAPQAIFKLPKADGDSEDASVRITYFPSMKGKDDMNIERWIGQVTKPDGKPFTKEEAKTAKSEMGNVRLTILDLTGNVKMTGWNEAKPNHRMIAAIVDHPEGPHYVVAGGPVKTMEKWAKDVDAFLKSAKARKSE